jgi:hypothetical protein
LSDLTYLQGAKTMKRTVMFLSLVLSICIVIPTIGFTYSDLIGQTGGEPGAEFIYGDATGNNLVSADDACAIKLYYVGLISGLMQFSAADVNNDGSVNIIDGVQVDGYICDYKSLIKGV